MSIRHGFESIWVREIPELRTRAERFVHLRTGAELLSLINEDENKVFGITFRTPPSDSTGLAHILEHSVLCGSRKYPVKEPFVELLKGSLQTFLNAMTYPDKTCYPVASQNVQDFYNLIDVYLDAVFYPRLTPFILQQEGWHLERDEREDRSATEGCGLQRDEGGSILPPTTCCLKLAAIPLSRQPLRVRLQAVIPANPQLTFEQFRAFHQKYYHPSNARIFFYGDDDPERRLGLVNDYLKDFERIPDRLPCRSSIAHFKNPGRITRPFPPARGCRLQRHGDPQLAPGRDPTDRSRTSLSTCWSTSFWACPVRPLRKALIDSGYGEDLAGRAWSSEIRQMYLSTGLKGIRRGKGRRGRGPDPADTLRLAREEGIDPRTVEAAVNTIEFALRENNTGSYPRGLVLMLRASPPGSTTGTPLP